MKESVLAIMGAAMFLAVAAVCIVCPRRIQQAALKWSAKGLGRFNPLRNWMQGEGYIMSLYVSAGLALVAAGILLVGVFMRLRK